MDIKKVGVIGTGNLGCQIAMICADAGYEVSTFDAVDNALNNSLAYIKQGIENKGAEPTIAFDKWDGLVDGIHQCRELSEAVKQADLVIEAVNEDLELKKMIFASLGKLAPPRAILATNSSSLPVSRVENSCGRPESCLNLHFGRPLEGLMHADLMGGSKTLPEVMDAGDSFLRSVNCLPLRVNKEVLGFCFNRVWRAVKKETLHMWADGVADFRDIDRGWMSFTGMKEGPFGFMDLVGLDVVHDIETVYYEHSKDPGDEPPKALKGKLEKGELGVKTQKGFYTYPNPEYLDADFMNPQKK